MSIKHAILGILSSAPMTGYDLKKVIADSPFMHWSGNNNQIYKALVALSDEGLVAGEAMHQDGAPSKKVYAITAAGLVELRHWTLEPPEPPELRRPFLVQLAWSWQLRQGELVALLDRYEADLRGRMRVECGRTGARRFAPDRTPRETAVWALIDEAVAGAYAQELAWLDRVRHIIEAYPDEEARQGQINDETEAMEMHYEVIERGSGRYIHVTAQGRQVMSEQDGLDLIALCAQHDARRLLIGGEALADDFYRLATGLAGAITQKLAQYSITAAIILDPARMKGKFAEFIAESNRGGMLRAYPGREEAERWLLD